MNRILDWMNGNKTYLGSIGWGVLGIAYSLGWMTEDIAGAVASILTAWTGVALRHAWKKAGA